MRKKGARTLTLKISLKRSSVVSKMLPRSLSPAALTSASTRPKRSSAFATTLRQSTTFARSASTKTGGQPGRRNCARAPPTSLHIAAADHEPSRSAFAEHPRDGLAQPLRAAGDDGDLAFQVRRPLIGRAGGRAGL